MTDLPRLYVVADHDYCGDNWRHYLAALGEVARRHRFLLQIRARDQDPAGLAAIAAEARELVRGRALLVLNGPAALAAHLGYDGVHWPERRVPERPADDPLPFRSAAAHSVAAVRRGQRAGATAILFAPVFSPTWKAVPGAGLAALRTAAAATPLPVYALGGIHPGRAGACRDAGAYGVAALSAVAADPARQVPCFESAL